MRMSHLMHHEYCNEPREGRKTWTFRHTNAPTVGPALKSMVARYAYSMLKIRANKGMTVGKLMTEA